jgi:serine/threonine protein kinase
MEFVPGGDLGTLISQERYLPEADVKIMAGQLLSALKHLHDKKITHRDVKPDNILIYTRHPLHVKLTDFGLSKMIDSEETFLRTFCGTLLYCAPEVYSEYREYDEETGQRNRKDRRALPKQRYGHAVDIWSLAGVLFYALCGSPPFPVKNGTSYQELLNRIMTQPLDIRPLQHANISDNGIRFVRSMLHTNPEHRATIEDLERASWFTGIDSQEFSLEEDEIDLIGDGSIDPALEEGTSQLTINPNGHEMNDSEELRDDISDLTEVLPLEIPGSFETSDGNISIDESYGFMKENVHPGNGRLFGEVNSSALGSSGVVPKSQLNLLLSSRSPRSIESPDSHSEYAAEHSRIENSFGNLHSSAAFVPTIMAPQLHTHTATRHLEVDDRAIRSSSLMGAESMVGHLNMHSPASGTSPVASPTADSPTPPTEILRDTTVSLRRPREEETDEDGIWRPADLPAKRRRKSEREIDILVPVSIFWDPKDKSTHHNNYPRMSTSEFQTYQEYAESKGEQFVHGQRTFEMTMQSFRSSRSPSMSPMEHPRAYSEPVKENSRRMAMKRDERKLAEVANGSERKTHSNGYATLDYLLPNTARPSNAASSIGINSASASPSPQPLVGNDFQPPKRILAKFIATPDSCLPTLTLNITESLTSWGRGIESTTRYSNGLETRIPKYAFKALLFKPGFEYTNPSLRTTQVWQERDQDMSFFISTKASKGIWVNGVNVESHERQVPSTNSKYWVKLRHNDLVDVWRNDVNPNIFTRLRFECYWGQSKEDRSAEDRIQLVPEGDFLDELETVCLSQEKAILKENERREKEERDVARLEQERERLARETESRH